MASLWHPTHSCSARVTPASAPPSRFLVAGVGIRGRVYPISSVSAGTRPFAGTRVYASTKETPPPSAVPELNRETLRRIATLGGLSFEAYSDPPSSLNAVTEQHGWQFSCTTTYTSETFLLRQFSGWVTVHLSEGEGAVSKSEVQSSAFAVIKAGQLEESDRVGNNVPDESEAKEPWKQKWCVAKTTTIQSIAGQAWSQELHLPIKMGGGRATVQILVFKKDDKGVPYQVGEPFFLCVESLVENPMLPLKVDIADAPSLVATLWYRTFQQKREMNSIPGALGVFQLFEDLLAPSAVEDLSEASSPFPVGAVSKPCKRGSFVGPKAIDLVQWATVPMHAEERRALKYLFDDLQKGKLVPWGALLAALEGEDSVVKTSMGNLEKICFVRGDGTQTECSVWRGKEDDHGIIKDRRIIVAFRGTESTKIGDLYTDANAAPTYWGNLDNSRVGFRNTIGDWTNIAQVFLKLAVGKILPPFITKFIPQEVMVHRGFLKAYKSVRAQLIYLIKQATADGGDWEVLLTGHSLGGALATVCAFDLANTGALRKRADQKGSTSISLCTFGSPRVGNSKFADTFNKYYGDTFRVVDLNDVVPTIPRLFGFYCHVNHGICLNPVRYPDDSKAEVTMPPFADNVVTSESSYLTTLSDILKEMRSGAEISGVQMHMGPFYYLAILHACEAFLKK